jgi:glutathione synthase
MPYKNMSKKMGVIMDPIRSIHYKKDSTLAMLWEAARRGYIIYYFEQRHLFVRDGVAWGNGHLLIVFQDPQCWFKLDEQEPLELSSLDILLMRKDPPFDLNYIYTTYVLELAEQSGVKVFNKPQSLRDANEKFFTAAFPDICVPTLITRDLRLLRDFFHEQKEIICKPLNAMNGHGVFHLQHTDLNANVIFETLTDHGRHFIMAQRFIPEITQGDKRILLIHGEPVPYALARIPAPGDSRGNLAAGAKGIAQPLSQNDLKICRTLAPVLRKKGLFFTGIDVIGDFLTEINVTSPTGIRELDEQCGLNISGILFDAIEKSF